MTNYKGTLINRLPLVVLATPASATTSFHMDAIRVGLPTRMGHLWSPILLLLLILSTAAGQQPKTTSCMKLEEDIRLNVTTELAYLTTPGFGEDYYPSNMNCRFFLTAPKGYRIAVTAEDVDMEKQLFDECLDFVQISKGSAHLHADAIATFCGVLKNRQLTSVDNQLVISMISDSLVESTGARLSYRAVSGGECEEDWAPNPRGYCLRLFQPKNGVDFVEAQHRCAQLQSNLATTSTELDYNFTMNYLVSTVNNFTTHPWIGYTDAQYEGTFQAVNQASKGIWPGVQPPINGNDDVRDCIYLDPALTHSSKGELAYRISDCRTPLSFLCEKKKDGSTVPAMSPADIIRRGSRMAGFDSSLLLLLIVLGILILIIFFICWQTCMKKRDTRIHSTDNQLVRGIDQSHPTHPPPPPTRTQQVTITSTTNDRAHLPPVRRDSGTVPRPLPPQPLPPVAAPVRNNNHTAVPNAAKTVEELRLQHQANINTDAGALAPTVIYDAEAERQVEQETSVLPGSPTLAAEPSSLSLQPPSSHPEPKPRTIPSLPIREETLHTLYTREGSFLRSKRKEDIHFDRPKMDMLDNVSAISLDEFWSNTKKKPTLPPQPEI